MAATTLPLGMQFTLFGGVSKDPFLSTSTRAGASIGMSIFDQILLGAEAEWRHVPLERGSYTAATGVRAFLFEHLQFTAAFHFSTVRGEFSRGILAGLSFSSDVLRTSITSHGSELPPELPGLDQLDDPEQSNTKMKTSEEQTQK